MHFDELTLELSWDQQIFDEIIVNAADNKQRDPSMNRIEVTIDEEEGSIRVWNNGSGIPVVVHQEHQIYVPELIFGNLLTGLLWMEIDSI